MKLFVECICKVLMPNPVGGGFSAGSTFEQIQHRVALEMYTPPPPFATLLRGGGGATAIAEFDPDTGGGSMCTANVLFLMVKNMQARLQHLVFTKAVQQPRYGDVLVMAAPNDMKDVSFITFPMMPLGETQSYDPKGCLVWVCSLSTWNSAQWLLSSNEAEVDMKQLGAFCYVHSAGPESRKYKVSPRLEGLPALLQDGDERNKKLIIREEKFPDQEKVPVVVWHMERVHTQFNQYTAFASMLSDVQPVNCGDLPLHYKPDLS